MQTAFRVPPAPDQRFLIEIQEPACVAFARSSQMTSRVKRAIAELEDCCACPRNCHIDRLQERARICHTGQALRHCLQRFSSLRGRGLPARLERFRDDLLR